MDKKYVLWRSYSWPKASQFSDMLNTVSLRQNKARFISFPPSLTPEQQADIPWKYKNSYILTVSLSFLDPVPLRKIYLNHHKWESNWSSCLEVKKQK